MMNKFTFNCPACSNFLEVESSWCGQKTCCPYCSKEILIPFPAAVPKAVPKAVVKAAVPNTAPKAVVKAVPRAAVKSEATESNTASVPQKTETLLGKKIKKYLILAGVIIVSLVLFVMGWHFFEWYTKTYLPQKEKAEIREMVSRASGLKPQERIDFLKKMIAEDSNQKKKTVADDLIQKAEDEIKQENLRRQLEAQRREEARKRELIRRQKAEKQAKLEQELQETYSQALNTDRGKNIFIIQKNNKKLPVRFALFYSDTEFEKKLREFEQVKQQKNRWDQGMSSLVTAYHKKQHQSLGDSSQAAPVFRMIEDINKKLPVLAADIAALGKKLIIDANAGFHTVSCAFNDIPSEKLLIAGFSKQGDIRLKTVIKKANLPLFVEYRTDGFHDVSNAHYNEQEQKLTRDKEDSLKKIRSMTLELQKSLQKKLDIAEKSKNLLRREQKVEPAAKHDPSKNITVSEDHEKKIPGLIFFAKLRDDFNTIGGQLIRRSSNLKFGTTGNVRGIVFPGVPSQGIPYKWRAISGRRPRTVSLWFYCSGYNRYDGGNSMFSYGVKNFGEYFDIETNREQKIGWAWDTKPYLAKKIENHRWNHFAITYDGRTRICYLNGMVVSRHDIRLRTAATPLMIGTRLNDQNHCFVGSIRNVAIYNRSLRPEDIKVLSRSGPALEQ